MSMPDLTEMQVKMEVQEVDYKRIEKGQKVNMIVDAANGLITTGSIKVKSMAAKTHYISEEAQFQYYEIIASVDSCHLQMPPGLSARCTIMINRVKDTIVVPSLAIFEKDSLKMVYVAHGNKFRQVPVETGLSNSSQTIISKGLSGNETIALVEPSQNFIEKDKQ
jgi:membrane fusion protein (multidrug efflux system)